MTAALSPCGKYRYRLTRGDGNLLPVVTLNPSTADNVVDDATIRRLLGFAQRGIYLYPGAAQRTKYDGIDVVNLYGLRATNPLALKTAADPYGPDNDAHLEAFCHWHAGAGIVVAWGTHAKSDAVQRFMRHVDKHARRQWLRCFGLTNAGHPRHPLYLSYATPLHRYQGPQS